VYFHHLCVGITNRPTFMLEHVGQALLARVRRANSAPPVGVKVGPGVYASAAGISRVAGGL
jgi:hypothetical protein